MAELELELSPRSQLNHLGKSFSQIMDYPSLKQSENQEIYGEMKRISLSLSDFAEYGFPNVKNEPLNGDTIGQDFAVYEHRREIVQRIRPSMKYIFWQTQNMEDEELSETILDFVELAQEIAGKVGKESKSIANQRNATYYAL